MERVYDEDEGAYFKKEFIEELDKRKKSTKYFTLEEVAKELNIKL